MSKKTIEQKYQKLDEIQHVLIRPGRYIGSVKPHTAQTWTINPRRKKFERHQLTWNPGFIKLFDEIVSNSVDESKREGSKLGIIKVNYDDDGRITVWDNGGIPVQIHSEHKQYIPEMIFGELRSGSNFDDDEDSVGTGQNGEGSSLVNIFSKEFIVETCDNKKKFVQTFTNNMTERSDPKVTRTKLNHTKITFMPDYEKLDAKFDDGNKAKLIKRVYDIAGCNPGLRVFLNGDLVSVRSFREYIRMYTDDFVYEENRQWRVGVGPSGEDGFQHVSFVNGEETQTGGTHIKYVREQITNKLRDHFKSKHKVDVRPADIANHLRLFIDATIVNPRYSSQTKDELITEVKDYKTSYTVSEKFIQTLIKSPIIQRILDWVQAKQNAAEAAELRKLSKAQTKTDPRRIVKLTDANEKRNRDECILFVTEGDSASKAIQSARDPQKHAVYPAKGKPANVRKVSVKQLIKPTKKGPSDFVEFMTVIGLSIGETVRHPKQLRYGQICFMTDADVDGSHIVGLFINLLYEFWPEMFEMGMVYRFITPLVKVKMGKKDLEFFNEESFHDWENDDTPKQKYTSKYFKGLGTSKTADFKQYLANMDKYMIPLTIEDDDDRDAISLAFDENRSDDRKEWLALAK